MDTPKLPLRKFKISIVTVPTMVEVQLFGAKTERKTIEIEGYTLADAKRRAGVR